MPAPADRPAANLRLQRVDAAGSALQRHSIAGPWWIALWPAPLAIDRAERWRVALGVGLGLLVAGGLSLWAMGALGLHQGVPWLIAPLGASAVLVFGLPASPLAQPWAVVAGNTAAALVGVACAAWLPWPVIAAPLAAALAVGAMMALRCLHPPGGAVALLAVLAGETQVNYALFPVLVNSALLVAAGWAYNRATGRRYPHSVQPEPARPAADDGRRFDESDIDAALGRYNQLSHLPRDDLQDMLVQAERHAHSRRLGGVRCGDIMSREPVTAEFGTLLQDAWTLLRRHRIKALPVLDRTRRVVGIVTLADFMRLADLDLHQGFDSRLRQMIRAAPGAQSDKPEVVGQIMTRKVHVASEQRSLGELLPIFTDTGHHHIPIIDADQRLVGIVTQTDLVRALAQPDRAQP